MMVTAGWIVAVIVGLRICLGLYDLLVKENDPTKRTATFFALLFECGILWWVLEAIKLFQGG
jgi:hypothetical protein